MDTRHSSRQPQAHSSPRASGDPRGWLPPVVVALIALAVFAPSLKNGFVNFDDPMLLLNNPHYRGFGCAHLRWMFGNTWMGLYMPLTWITYALDFIVWGMNPFGYHLTNILFHAANAAVFYGVCRLLLRRALPAFTQADDGAVTVATVAGALFFAIHPLRVESVTWITERRDVVSGLFYLLAIWAYLSAAVEQDFTRRRRLKGCSVVAFMMSLLGKGSGVTLPAILLLFDVYPLRRLLGNPTAGLKPPARMILKEKMFYLLPALLVAVVGIGGQANSAFVPSLERLSVSARAAQACYGYVFYIWKTLLPLGLLPAYKATPDMGLSSPGILLCAGIIAGISMGAFAARKSHPGFLAVWVFYLVTLAPMAGVFKFGSQLVADRYSYLSCLGWAVLASGAVAQLLRGARVLAKPALTLAGMLLCGLAILTWRQIHVWHDSEGLWRYTISHDPEFTMAHMNLGVALVEQGRFDEAIQEYRKGLAISPRHRDTLYNLSAALRAKGNLLLALGRYSDAASWYAESLAIRPDDVECLANLGIALAAQGHLQDAAEQFRRAILIDGRRPGLHLNLGSCLARQGRLDEAIAQFRVEMGIDPDNAQARNNLQLALSHKR